MGTYRDLLAWQKAMDLVDVIYSVVERFPKSELFGASLQIRKAALSIPLNLAEGRGRYSRADQRHFYVQARGSVAEVDTLIEFARRREWIPIAELRDLEKLVGRVGRLVNGLVASVSENRGFDPEGRGPKAEGP